MKFDETNQCRDSFQFRNVWHAYAFMKNNYLYRYAGAKLGLYGNSADEAIYLAYFVDASNAPLDASKNNYVLRFPGRQFPQARASTSLLPCTTEKSQFLVANPLKRYLLNSTMLVVQIWRRRITDVLCAKILPGSAKGANWLPAPDGPFLCKSTGFICPRQKS